MSAFAPVRIRHLATKIREDGAVSALCFKKPRAIDMFRASWTSDARSVTCTKCLALIEARKVRR